MKAILACSTLTRSYFGPTSSRLGVAALVGMDQQRVGTVGLPQGRGLTLVEAR